MIMYSAILVLIIAIAVLGYCLRHAQANNTRLKMFAQAVSDQFVDMEENSRKDAETIKQLTWERDAAHFMLETVINDLPEDHQVTMVRRPTIKETREVSINENRRSWPGTIEEIPEQRTPSGKAYFKEPL